MIDYIALVIVLLVAIFILFLYFVNIYKLIKSIDANEWGIKLLARGIGIFFPVVGIVMAFIS